MLVFYFFYVNFLCSIAPKSLYLTDEKKIEFLKSIFRSQHDEILCMDCHTLSGILPDLGSNLSESKHYDEIATYHVRGFMPVESMLEVKDFPEEDLADYSVIAIYAGKDPYSARVCHSCVFYKGLTIEKYGQTGDFEITDLRTSKYEKWINREELYFFDLKTLYMHQYIELQIHFPQEDWLKKRVQDSVFLDFVMEEKSRLNQLLSQARPILKKYSHKKHLLQKGYIVGWKELLDQGVVQKIFPEIDVKTLYSSLDDYDEIPLQKFPRFLRRKNMLVAYVKKDITKYA